MPTDQCMNGMDTDQFRNFRVKETELSKRLFTVGLCRIHSTITSYFTATGQLDSGMRLLIATKSVLTTTNSRIPERFFF